MRQDPTQAKSRETPPGVLVGSLEVADVLAPEMPGASENLKRHHLALEQLVRLGPAEPGGAIGDPLGGRLQGDVRVQAGEGVFSFAFARPRISKHILGEESEEGGHLHGRGDERFREETDGTA